MSLRVFLFAKKDEILDHGQDSLYFPGLPVAYPIKHGIIEMGRQ